MDDLISRQEAIDALHMRLMYRMGTDSNKKRLDEWINNLPSAQETHEERTETHACDLISRQAAIDALNKLSESTYEVNYGVVDCDDAINAIAALPPTEPKKGKWIKTARWGMVYYCDQCRNYLDFDGVNAGRGSANFCPNCGADMRGEEE